MLKNVIFFDWNAEERKRAISKLKELGYYTNGMTGETSFSYALDNDSILRIDADPYIYDNPTICYTAEQFIITLEEHHKPKIQKHKHKQPKYVFDVAFEVVQRATIELEALDEEQARRKAKEIAYGYPWKDGIEERYNHIMEFKDEEYHDFFDLRLIMIEDNGTNNKRKAMRVKREVKS